MLTENRFYNYDDALAGIVDHLAKTPSGQIRNLSLLITDGSRTVASYDPNLHQEAKTFLSDIDHVCTPRRRLTLVQEYYNVHVYTETRLDKFNATVVIDSLLTGTATGMLHVIHDTLRRLAEAQSLTVGTVYLFAIEASV